MAGKLILRRGLRYLKPHRYRLWATHNHYKRRNNSALKHLRASFMDSFYDDLCYCLDRIDDVPHPYVSPPLAVRPRLEVGTVDLKRPHVLVSNKAGELVARPLSDRAIQQFIDAFDASYDRATGIRRMP